MIDLFREAEATGYVRGWNEALDSASYILADLMELDNRFGELIAVLTVLKMEIPK